jgi:hypothetical protein
MVIDDKLIQGFKNQINVLTNLSNTVQRALNKATDQYQRVSAPDNFGKNIEDIFGPIQQRSAAQGGGGKDHRGHR